LDGQKPNLKASELLKRLILSAFLLGGAYVVVFLFPFWGYIAVIQGFILVALNEYWGIFARRNIVLNRPLILAIGFLTPLALLSESFSFLLVVMIGSFFLADSSREKLPSAFRNAAFSILGIVWISLAFSYLLEIRLFPQGSGWVYYVILVTKLGDAGAYFVGKRFGRRKFANHISPNKTWEGAIAQIAVSFFLSLGAGLFFDVSVGHLALLGILLGLLAEVGDLIESMLKRGLDVKDSGDLPGLGGVLDVLDSLLLTVPFTYFYVIWFVLS